MLGRMEHHHGYRKQECSHSNNAKLKTMTTHSVSTVYSIARRGDAIRFNHEVCKTRLNEVPTDFAGKTVLDVACGHENPFFTERLRLAKLVIGLDRDPSEIQKNGVIQEGHIGDIHSIPLPSDSIDVVVSVDTIEHSADPDVFLKECCRVLRSGGEAIFATPNLVGYKNAFARFSGKRVFDFVWKAAHNRVLEYDTHYRCNTSWAFRRKARNAGFRVLEIRYVPEISWFLSGYPVAFTLAHAYNGVTGALGLEGLWGYMLVRLLKV
jgi:2-polyprenyl-3-methyl-5-hydroxy-6-metoxy-1,4-benzoquinol methylase